jgi:RNA polymerase sigma factor (sigma-70 family)
MRMNEPRSGSIFQTTQWSMVVAAHDDPEVLNSLLATYWGPIYTYIRRAGRSREDAADFTQEFIQHVMLERGLIERANPERGRFRTFIKSSLRRFLIDIHRHTAAKGRSPGAPVLGGPSLDALEPSGTDDPSSAFDRQWAATLLSVALERLEADCISSGQQAHWAAFSALVVEPALRHTAPMPVAEVATQLNLDSGHQVSSMIQTVRRKFRRLMADVVRETVADPSEAEDEIRQLGAFLGL